MTYSNYIKSKQWGLTRDVSVNIAGKKCFRCGCKLNLESHHTSYKDVGGENFGDLEVLCKRCHSDAHFTGNEGKKLPGALFIYTKNALPTKRERRERKRKEMEGLILMTEKGKKLEEKIKKDTKKLFKFF